MRFTLAYVSTALLASVAMAAPSPQRNTEGEVNVSARSTATPLDYDLKFQTFNWATKEGKTSVDRSFSLDLTEPASLQITDYKLGGDMYEISDNGKIIGMTSNSNSTTNAFAETPEDAVADKRFSRGEFNLAKGHHDITINVHQSPYGVGSGAVRVVKKLQALYGKDHDDDDDDDEDWEKHDDDDDDYDDDDDDDDWEKDDHDDDWEKDDHEDGWKKHGNKHKGSKKHGKKKVVYVYHTLPCTCDKPITDPVPLVDPEEKGGRELRPIDPTTSYSRKETLMEVIIDFFSDYHSHRRNIKSKHRSVFDNVVSVMTSGHDDLRTAIHSDIRDLLSDKMSHINAKLPVLRMARA
ncbi:hypothetical protein BCR42DRAFT_95041 [Absidia repens]|uniref:Uncharacterized protein n=1 Tax=Absidia repens TaxID=90262 RepID=A0A1X2IZH1_9FUNG|nr:hypothetical protein BCR42DRAFT_95041 [Absidia repens]